MGRDGSVKSNADSSQESNSSGVRPLRYSTPRLGWRVNWLELVVGVFQLSLAGLIFAFGWAMAHMNLPSPGPEPQPPFQPNWSFFIGSGLFSIPFAFGGIFLCADAIFNLRERKFQNAKRGKTTSPAIKRP